MAEPFLSEIRIMSFTFAPRGWALCNGQFLPINQNQALFALIGTMYGGDGQTTFALPDLRPVTPQSANGQMRWKPDGVSSGSTSFMILPARIAGKSYSIAHTLEVNSSRKS